MQISIQIDEKIGTGTLSGQESLNNQRPLFCCCRLKTLLCQLSILNILTLFALGVIAITAIFLCKTYLHSVLYWLENQDSPIVACTVIILFIIVSLPISIGYIILVVSNGYLFGMFYGLCLTVIGANTGLFVAHQLLRLLSHHNSVRRFNENDTAKAITRVISGPLCFKIVCCARLTPIPFGLQNTIFALSKVSGRVYHLASFLGLLPAQVIAVYVGSTLRSMQDVLESRNINRSTYILVAAQLLMGASLMIWIGTKARKELLKAIAEGENKLSSMEKSKNVISRLIV